MHKSENEKIDFILDEHERISRKQGSLCMALGKGFLVIAILCGVATFCVSGLYLKSLCLSVACCCGVGFAPIFPDICYHLTHYKPAAADIPVASDNPAHYADAIRYNARTPLQGSLLPLTRLVWA